MKKVLSLFLSIVMLVSTLSISFNSYAGGWLDDVQKIDFNTTYTESCDVTDYYLDRYYYDSFEFTVPLKGTVNLYIESENSNYFRSNWYPAFYYIYSTDDTTNYLYKFSDGAYYDSGRGMYFLSKDFTLSQGTYYLVAKYYNGGHDGTYNFILDYKPNMSKPSTFKVSTRNTTSLKLSWGKVSGVSGYQLQRKSGDSYKTLTNTTATSYTVKSLSAGTSYTFRVRAYKTVNGTKYYSGWKTLTTITKPAKPSIKAPSTNKKHQIIAKWKAVSKCTGYQVQYSKKKNFSSVIATKTVAGRTKTSYTGKNFTKGKTYYVRVRSYKTVNGTKYYSAWSSVKSIKCK